MTDKRFNYVSFDGFTDNGKELDAHEVLDLLNELHEENQRIKTIITEAYNTERTQIGQNVLKQIMEQL